MAALKIQDVKLTDQIAGREIAGLDIVGLKNTAERANEVEKLQNMKLTEVKLQQNVQMRT